MSRVIALSVEALGGFDVSTGNRAPYRPTSSLLVFRLVCLCVWVLTRSTSAQESVTEYGELVSPADTVSVLEFLSKRCEGNYQRIETWDGVCRFENSNFIVGANPSEEEHRKPGEKWVNTNLPVEMSGVMKNASRGEKSRYWMVSTGAAEFSVDNVRGKYYVCYRPADIMTVADPLMEHPMDLRGAPFAIHSIVTSESSIEFSPGRQVGEVNGFPSSRGLPVSEMVVVRTPGEGKRSIDFIDVRDCFASGTTSSANVELWYWTPPSSFAKSLRGEKSEQMRANAERSVRIYKTEETPPTYHLVFGELERKHSVTTYSGRVGFNVVKHLRAEGSEEIVTRTTTYQQVKGVYLPETMKCLVPAPSSRNDRKAAYVHSWTIGTRSLNEPIDETRFGIDHFHLKYADKIHDQVASTLTVIDERGVPMDVEKFKYDSTHRRDRQLPANRGNATLLVANLLAILLVVGVLVFRRPKRKAP